MDPHVGSRLTDECRTLLEYVRDAVLFIRVSDGGIVAANRVAEELYRYPAADLLKMRVFELLDSEFSNPAIPMDDATRGGQITEAGVLFESSHRRSDGTTFPVETSARIALVDGERMVIAVVRDITERREIERSARDALAEIHQVFDTAADGLRIIDRDFNVTRINSTFAEMAHLDYDAALRLKCYESFSGVNCHTERCSLTRALQGDGRVAMEVLKTCSDGSTVNCVLTAQPFVIDGKIVGVIEDFGDITLRKRAEELAHHLATHDALTGLPNRLLLTDRLDVTLAQARRGETHPALMFCDIDRFKDINDTLGHVIGDEVLISIADTLTASVRGGDTVARQGGDEFVVLLPQVKSSGAALHVARKILDATEVISVREHAEIGVTLSVGIAMYEEGDDADDLMRRADDAMYRVKERGGNGLLLGEDDGPSPTA